MSAFTIHKDVVYIFICLFSPFIRRHGGIDSLPAAPHVHAVYFPNTRGSYRACSDSCSEQQLNGLLGHWRCSSFPSLAPANLLCLCVKSHGLINLLPFYPHVDTEKRAQYIEEERQMREENIRLQRKLQREMERREALCRQLSESESSLEMDDER